MDKETATLLTVAESLKAGFDVKFVTGAKKDPTIGGYLVPPHDDLHDVWRQTMALALQYDSAEWEPA